MEEEGQWREQEGRAEATVAEEPVTYRKKMEEILRACLDWERKFFGCHIGCVGRMSGEFLKTNKKTNYIARQETARQIY